MEDEDNFFDIVGYVVLLDHDGYGTQLFRMHHDKLPADAVFTVVNDDGVDVYRTQAHIDFCNRVEPDLVNLNRFKVSGTSVCGPPIWK